MKTLTIATYCLMVVATIGSVLTWHDNHTANQRDSVRIQSPQVISTTTCQPEHGEYRAAIDECESLIGRTR